MTMRVLRYYTLSMVVYDQHSVVKLEFAHRFDYTRAPIDMGSDMRKLIYLAAVFAFAISFSSVHAQSVIKSGDLTKSGIAR